MRTNYLSYLTGLALLAGCPMYSQSISSGTVAGTVADPSGAVIADAAVQLRNPVTRYEQTLKTDSAGAFRFNNIPQNSYRLTAASPGFASAIQDVDVQELAAYNRECHAESGRGGHDGQCGGFWRNDRERTSAHQDVDKGAAF